MTNTKGYRRGTRYMFSRGFKQHGVTPLSRFMKVYKVGDFVDVKVCVAVLCILFGLHTILYTLTMFDKNLWGSSWVVHYEKSLGQAYHGCITKLEQNG